MNCATSFLINLHLPTNFFHLLKIQQNSQNFTSYPNPIILCNCSSDSSNKSTSLRRRTNYQISSWKNTQIQSLNTSIFTGDMYLKKREKLKEELKCMIKEKDFAEQLELFDWLQKLGVEYHFEEEIKTLLNLGKSFEEKIIRDLSEDVYVIALYFRLSREHGFEASKDLLVKSYKEKDSCYKTSILSDPKGMLSLYEASFLAMNGEDEVDEVKEFALKQLNDFIRSNSSSNPMFSQYIAMTLKIPLHNRIPKLQVKMFMEYACNMKELNVDPIVLELAQLDFNITQSIYQRELKEITSWWTKISNLASGKLSFAREWPVESYFVAASLANEPKLSTCRRELAKAICFINVIDDIYDIYGTLEELQLFTEAIDRWDFATIKSLPEYMKICLSELFNTANSLAYKIMEQKGFNILPHLKRAWQDLCKAYMVEARWYYSGYIPKFQDYLDNAWISVGAPLASVIAHCLSENLTNLSLENIEFYPSFIRHSSTIFRLYNDLATSKGEIGRGDVPKSIQCYIEEKKISELETHECIKNIVNKSWKELNREWIKGSIYEKTFEIVAINLPRLAHLLYMQSNDENAGELNLDKMKESVISLIFEPITFKNR